MGIGRSQPDDRLCSAPTAMSTENIEDSSENEDFILQPIAEDLLISVLSFVPAKDLILNCRLVCKQWKNVIDSQSVWRLKCERENVKLPSRKFIDLPRHHYRYVYLHSIRTVKNLVKNPCGENKFDGWIVQTQYGDQETFKIENPPVGADPVPEQVGSQSCFATTYHSCEKHQKICLDDPIHRYLLQHDLVKIKVGEWYAARFDCASEYKLGVYLYNQTKSVIDNFNFEYEEEQWTGREWHLVAHEFDNVTDVYFIKFIHHGKDRQYWAGHYGSKMTGAFVELCIK